MLEKNTISEVIDHYCNDYCWQRGFSRSTIDNYLWVKNSFTKQVGDVEIGKLETKHIIKWRKKMEDMGYEVNTVNAYLYKFRRIVTHYSTICSISPKEIIIPKKERKDPHFLTDVEIQMLIHADLIIRDRAIISLMYSTGMRVSEVVRLRRNDIIGDDLINIQGKGKIERKAFIDATAQFLIAQYLNTRDDKSPALFLSRLGGGLKKSGIEKIIRDAGIAAGLTQRVYPHMLRHTFATHLVQRGIGQFHLRDLLGHADISTTQMYVHLGTKDLKDSYEKYHKAPAI